MSFNVVPGVVRAAGEDMRSLGTALGHMNLYVQDHLHLEDAQGTIIAALGDRVNGIREQMVTDYGPTGVARRAYTTAASGLDEVATAYERIDEDVAAQFDSSVATHDLDMQSAPTTYMPPEFDVDDVISGLTTPEEGFGDLDAYNDLAQGIDYVVGLDWLSDMLTTVGLLDPFGEFKDKLEGDWNAVGKAVGALQVVADTWTDIAGKTRAIPNHFDWQRVDNQGVDVNVEFDGWSGNAAQAATWYCQNLADKGVEHEGAISGKVIAITGEVFAVNDILDQLIGLIEDLIELLPWGESIEDFLKNALMPWKQADRLVKAAGAVAKIVTKVRLVFDGVALFLAILGELQSLLGTDFPSVDPYSVPDVDGV